MASPKPPEYLSRAAKAWWRQVHDGYDLDDHHRHLLRLACESLDQSEEARAAISDHGAVVLDRFGCQKPSPWVDIQHKAQNRFRILCRELGLDVEPGDGPRLPRDATYGNRR
ncbi:P27 family phage terminase small subunit [Bradyrhizobium symbiodeficiens]|uniref:P27 family phage terminase small subunit n=1 Tax=Bradyrhizobium symbiodeficiens TaxID=1404367 RepID=UPI0030D0D367